MRIGSKWDSSKVERYLQQIKFLEWRPIASVPKLWGGESLRWIVTRNSPEVLQHLIPPGFSRIASVPKLCGGVFEL